MKIIRTDIRKDSAENWMATSDVFINGTTYVVETKKVGRSCVNSVYYDYGSQHRENIFSTSYNFLSRPRIERVHEIAIDKFIQIIKNKTI